jgi:hypothetical protein
MLRVMLIGGLAPILVAAASARLRARTFTGAARILLDEGWLTERLVHHLVCSLSLSAFFWAFACWKSTIPLVHPFSWDETLGLLDVALHRGQADALLAPFFGAPRTLIALDRLYETWAYVLFALMLWQIWQSDLVKAKRFLLAFALTWIVLGIFGATVFSSAGPCYTELVTGSHRYDGLFARLRGAESIAPLAALKGQSYLWYAHVGGLVPQGSGISAFPSLHVASATLAALAVWEHTRLGGALVWVYVALTWVASVMLGWHYAIDGEFAVGGVLLCWQLAGWLLAYTQEVPAAPISSWRFDRQTGTPPQERVREKVGQSVRETWSLFP